MPITPIVDYTQLTYSELIWIQNAAGLTYAKGTILVANNSGILQTLGTGTNTQVLIADSVQTLGIKWGTGTGTGSSIEIPTGVVDGVNITFTVSNTPIFVVIDGLVRRDTLGYAYAAGTITVDSLTPPTFDIFSIY